jgi:DHA3 family macrolide efflux protein-like MFS transporter
MSQSQDNLSGWRRRFVSIWTGQAFSLFGSSLVHFALIWWLTDSTRSATVLATASLVGMLPQILLGPFAGALVDRWNRRRVMIAADASIAVVTLILVLLFASGQIQVWHVYAVLLYRSAAGAFHYTAMTASTSLMVPTEHLSRVNGANQALNGAMNIVAPPAGALLLSLLPMQGVLAIDIVTALLGIVPLLFFAIPQPARAEHSAGAGGRSVLGDVRAGLRYVFAWPGLLMIIGMAMLLNFLLTPAFSLLPLLVTNHFEGQAPQLAALQSASGVGLVVGGLALAVWGGFKSRMFTSMMGIIGIGAGTLLIGVAPATALPLAVAGMFIVSFMQPMANGPLHAVLQAVVEPAMQGRVFTLVMSGAVAMTPLSLAVAGPLADRIGIQTWYVVAGLTCIAVGVVMRFTPALRNIEDRQQAAQTNVEAVPEGAVQVSPEAATS